MQLTPRICIGLLINRCLYDLSIKYNHRKDFKQPYNLNLPKYYIVQNLGWLSDSLLFRQMRWRKKIFSPPYPSRPTLGPTTQSPLQWGPCLFPRDKAAGALRLPPMPFVPPLACHGVTFTFTLSANEFHQ